MLCITLLTMFLGHAVTTQSERFMNDGQQVGEPSAELAAVITYMCTCIRARMYVYMFVGHGQELRFVLT